MTDSGDGGEGGGDELPCAIEGEDGEDCVWRGKRSSVGSSFQRQGAAYRKERLVIFSVDVSGWPRYRMVKNKTRKRQDQYHS